MANIDIQRSGTRIWPWLLGLIIVAALIIFFAAARDRTPESGIGAGPDDSQTAGDSGIRFGGTDSDTDTEPQGVDEEMMDGGAQRPPENERAIPAPAVQPYDQESERQEPEDVGMDDQQYNDQLMEDEDEGGLGGGPQDAPQQQATSPDTVPSGQGTETIQQFVNFVKAHEADDAMELDHNYASEGIEHLSSALGAVAEQHGIEPERIRPLQERMQERATNLRQDPTSTQHARMIREAFDDAGNIMDTLSQQNADTQDTIQQVKQAAQDINPEQQALEQKDQVDNFFERSSEAIQSLSQQPPQPRD